MASDLSKIHFTKFKYLVVFFLARLLIYFSSVINITLSQHKGKLLKNLSPRSRLRWYDHVERMQNQVIPRHIAKATLEGIWKRGRLGKKVKDKVEEDLKAVGIKK
jgi:hypothetical protein